MLKSLTISLLVFNLLLIVVATEKNEGNLVKNGGFEDNDGKGTPTGWRIYSPPETGTYKIFPDAKTGKNALLSVLKPQFERTSNGVHILARTKIDQSGDHLLKLHVLNPEAKPLAYACYFLDHQQRRIKDGKSGADKRFVQQMWDWRKIKKNLDMSGWVSLSGKVSVPENAKFAEIMLAAYGDGILFDDVSLERISQKAPDVTSGKAKLIINEDFSSGKLPKDWKPLIGKWKIKDGALLGEGATGAIISIDKNLGRNLRVEYTGWTNSPTPSDLSVVFACNRGSLGKKGNPINGYFIGFGSENNTLNKITWVKTSGGLQLLTRSLWEGFNTGIKQGVKHKIVAERNGSKLSLYIDGKLELFFDDPMSDAVDGDGLVFYLWSPGHIDDVKVYALPESRRGGVRKPELKLKFSEHLGFQKEKEKSPPSSIKISKGTNSSVEVVNFPTWVVKKDGKGRKTVVDDLCVKIKADGDQPVLVGKDFPELDSGIVEFDIFPERQGELRFSLLDKSGGILTTVIVDETGKFSIETPKGVKPLKDKIEYRRRKLTTDFRFRPHRWLTLRMHFDAKVGIVKDVAVMDLYSEIRGGYARNSVDQGDHFSLGMGFDFLKPGKVAGFKITVVPSNEVLLDNLIILGPVGTRTVKGKNILLPTRIPLGLDYPLRKDPVTLRWQSTRHMPSKKSYQTIEDVEYFSDQGTGGHPHFLKAADSYNRLTVREAFAKERVELFERTVFYLKSLGDPSPTVMIKDLIKRLKVLSEKAEKFQEEALQSYTEAYWRAKDVKTLRDKYAGALNEFAGVINKQEELLAKVVEAVPVKACPNNSKKIMTCSPDFPDTPLRWNTEKKHWMRDGLPEPYFHCIITHATEQARRLGLWPYTGSLQFCNLPFAAYNPVERGDFIDRKLVEGRKKNQKNEVENAGRRVQSMATTQTGTHYCLTPVPGWWIDENQDDPDIFFYKNDGTPYDKQYGYNHGSHMKSYPLNYWNPKVNRMLKERFRQVGQMFETSPEFGEIVFVYMGGESYNELPNGQEPGHNPSATKAFQEELREKYGDIDSLNKKWRTDYSGFDKIVPPGKRTPPSPLQYEFRKFQNLAYFDTYMKTCVDAMKGAYSKDFLVGHDFQNSFGKYFDMVSYFDTFDIPFFHTYQIWDRRIHGRWLESLSDACGKPWGSYEWKYTQGLPEMLALEPMRLHGIREMFLAVMWGNAMPNIFVPWDAFNWQYALSVADHRTGRLLLNYFSTFLPVSVDRARRMAGPALSAPLATPDVAILEVTSSYYNEYPVGSVRDLMKNISVELDRTGWNFGFLYERLLLDGRQKLDGIQSIIIPNGVCVPKELDRKLEGWVRKGGTLICYGPVGVLNQYGQPADKALIKDAFPNIEWKNKNFTWWTPEKTKPVFEKGNIKAYQAKLGKGSVFVFNNVMTWNQNADTGLSQFLDETTRRSVGSSDPENLCLCLRQKGNEKYLYVLNYSRDKTVEAILFVKGNYSSVVDAGLEIPLAIPHEFKDGRTIFKTRLSPAMGTIFKLTVKTGDTNLGGK